MYDLCLECGKESCICDLLKEIKQLEDNQREGVIIKSLREEIQNVRLFSSGQYKALNEYREENKQLKEEREEIHKVNLVILENTNISNRN